MYSEFIARKDAYLNRLFSDNFLFELLIFHDGVCNVWVCVCVGCVMCGCFGNMCTCFYRVLYYFYCAFCISFMFFLY